MRISFVLFVMFCLMLAACSTTSSKWRMEGPPNQKVMVKAMESWGGDYDFSSAHIGVADPVIASFTASGPSERKQPLTKLPGPSIRLKVKELSYLNRELNIQVQEALNINADPTTISNELWQAIRAKYPSLTHLAVTLFNVAETYKISEEWHHLAYMWSSSIVCRTMIVDLNKRSIIAEWRQDVRDRSTWTDACSAPEELAHYLEPVTHVPSIK